jgi:hypothetical protein
MNYLYAQPYERNNEINDKEKVTKRPCYTSLYMISHFIVSLFAIYLSWRCNSGFNPISFLLAFFCPYFYIIFALATRGGCGIFDANCLVEPIKMISR